MTVTTGGNAQLAERIESRIDKDLAGGIEVFDKRGSISIAPRNMGELMEFAKMMSLSGPCIRPFFRNNPGACLAICLQAMRWGADPIAVANKVFSVNDQLAYESQLIHAIVNERAPLQKRLRTTYAGIGEKRICTITGLLDGETEPAVYDSPETGKISPKNSPLWKTDPDQQLFYYSVRAWARRHVPEVLLGVYTVEEIQDHQPIRGADGARDVTSTIREDAPPPPKRSDFVEKEPETAEYAILTADGEIKEATRVGSVYVACLLADLRAAIKEQDDVEALWSANYETLDRVRAENPNLDVSSLNSVYHEWVDAQAATQQKPAASDPQPQPDLLGQPDLLARPQAPAGGYGKDVHASRRDDLINKILDAEDATGVDVVLSEYRSVTDMLRQNKPAYYDHVMKVAGARSKPTGG